MPRSAKNKQMAVLSYIHKQVTEHGYPPTVREICSAVGLSSTSTVHGHITRLIDKGLCVKTC
ncbi:MAG: LexA family protein [Limosilactobacillus pontis]